MPATFRFGTSSVPVLGLYRRAPVSSRSPLLSLWKTTGKLLSAVLSVTVTLAAVPLVSAALFGMSPEANPLASMLISAAVAVIAASLVRSAAVRSSSSR